MYGYNPYSAARRELASDMQIQRNVPGGLNSKYMIYTEQRFFIICCSILGPLGESLDSYMGGNLNPTYGQVVGDLPGVGGYGYGYGYSYRRW